MARNLAIFGLEQASDRQDGVQYSFEILLTVHFFYTQGKQCACLASDSPVPHAFAASAAHAGLWRCAGQRLLGATSRAGQWPRHGPAGAPPAPAQPAQCLPGAAAHSAHAQRSF